MPTSYIRHTDLPGTSKLFADVLYGFPKAAAFYAFDASQPESYVQAAARTAYPESRRTALIDALREDNGASPALARLAQPGAVAVVTGQQAGLFSGPAYTVYKALTAVKLAQELSARGTPAVPVFWLATEDHDLEEVRHAWIFDAQQTPIKLSVESAATERPVGGVAISQYPLEALRAAFDGLPFASDALRMAEAAYTPGATLGAAFLALLKTLLAPYELVYLDPLRPSIRAIAAPLLQAALERSADLVARVRQRGDQLSAAGYHAQVHVDPDSSLFFLLDGERRVALKRDLEAFTAKGRRYSAHELAGRAETLSPNALLRPVVQDYLLPTVAHVGGPAEIAYLAQSETLYQALGVNAPVETPRSGFTLLDSRATKLMQRYTLELQSFFQGEDALKAQIASRLAPDSLSVAFGETRDVVTAQLDRLRRDVVGFDPTLAAAFDKSHAKMLYQLSKAQGKLARELLRRDATAARDATYLCNLIYPHRHLQERFYSFLPLLAKHGPELLPRVYENIRLDCPDHVVLPV